MLIDIRNLAADLTRDDSGRLSSDDIDKAVGLALQRYSQDRPQAKVQDVTPTTTTVLPLPAAWETGFSEISALEYPIGENPPSYIPTDRYCLYQDPSAITIRVIDGVDVTKSVRVGYGIAHVVSATVDTIPLKHREAVSCWAAACLCGQLASWYSSGSDSTIQADSVQQRSKAQEYAARALSLRKQYENEIGVQEKRNVAAGAVVELRKESSTGSPHLSHPLRRSLP